MKQIRKPKYSWAQWGVLTFLMGVGLVMSDHQAQVEALEFQNSHLGTFEGKTIFTTSSQTGVQPTLDIEIKNQDGTLRQYNTSSGSLAIPNTQEGATVKSAILRGQTLVNLFKNKIAYRDTNKFTYVEEGDKIQATFKSGYTNGWIGFSFNNNIPFEIGKTYTAINEFYSCDDKLKTFSLVIGNKSFTNDQPVIGINKLKITIPSDYAKGTNWMYYSVDNINTGTTTFSSNLLILEGDYTQEDIPYFEGIQTVKVPVLTITNGEPEQIKNEQGQWIPNPAFQSTAITFEEEVILRSNGGVYDELDLMTGKLTQRLDENNEVLTKPIVRTVKMKAEPIFNAINQADVSVVGEVKATIASVTLPTAPLSFVLDPNKEPSQQFIASEFSLTNESQAPLTIELKEFVQTTDIFNDVTPDYYDEWENLTKEESKNIALGLVPRESESWLTFNPGVYYVAKTSNEVLGRVKSQSTVDFSFTALHGQAFDQLPNPQYRLTFVFGF